MPKLCIHARLLAAVEPDAVAIGSDPIANSGFLIAALLLVFAASRLAIARTASSGNYVGAIGVLVAIVTTVWRYSLLAPIAFGTALAVGAIVGLWLAGRAKVTARANLAPLFTSFGGLATNVVAGAALLEERDPSAAFVIAAALAGILSGIALAGGLVAYFKRENYRRFAHPVLVPAHRLVSFVVLLVAVGFGVWLVQSSRQTDVANYALNYVWLSLAALASGTVVILPIERAALPGAAAILIGVLGFAIAATGFVLDNMALIIVGTMIGASGIVVGRRDSVV